MTKPAALSEAAKAAVTEEDLWSLFFSQQILDEIVTWTNQKIEARILQKNYSAETLKKSPHISTTDEVIIYCIYKYLPFHFFKHQCCGSEIIFSDPDQTFSIISDPFPDPFMDPTYVITQ